MTRQCEIVAVASGIKSRTQKNVTELYKLLQRDVFGGLSRTYTPKMDDGDQYPAEHKKLEATVKPIVIRASTEWERLIDVIVTQDTGNSLASANIEIDGKVLAENVPAVTLIFLEKHFQDIRSFVGRLPTLDPTKHWEFSEDADAYTASRESVKTKKTIKHKVVVQPTDKHPAQVVTDTIDEVEGTWKITEFSGAIPETKKRETIEQVDKLLDAIKIAREKANATEIKQIKVAKGMLDFVFQPLV
jgi:hypothetical protein